MTQQPDWLTTDLLVIVVSRYSGCDRNKKPPAPFWTMPKGQEFNRLPEIATLEPELRNVFMARSPSLDAPVPKAANDNGWGWPFIPFPDDWYATC